MSNMLVVATPKRETGRVGMTAGRALKRPPATMTNTFSITMLIPIDAMSR